MMALATTKYMAIVVSLLCMYVETTRADSDGEEGGAGGTFSDYLPMKYLSVSRSAQQEGGATKSLFFDFLPSELKGKPNYLEIRSLYSGNIQVIESAQFGISVNVSGKSTYELSSVKVEYTAINDTILLQVKGDESLVGGGLSSLITLAIIAGVTWGLVLLVTVVYLCFWKMKFEKAESYKDIDEGRPEGMTRLPGDSKQELDDMLTDDDNRNAPLLGNGDISKPMELSVRDSNSDHNASRTHRRQRYRTTAQKSRDISSSEDLSSVDDNWTKRKASWRKGHARSAQEPIPEMMETSSTSDPGKVQGQYEVKGVRSKAPRRQQFSDFDITSGDAGFSSGNDYQPNRNRMRGPVNRRQNSSMDDMEWDEYDTAEGALPPPSSILNGWTLSTDDEDKTAEPIWPPPLDEPLLATDDPDKGLEGNMEDVREAIHNAMDSVNSDMNSTRDSAKPESPHDDGYETGVAVNGHTLASAVGAGLPPPTAPKPTRPNNNHRGGGGGGGGGKPSVSRVTSAVVMSVAILSLCTGVYGVVSNLTKVNIVIFIPDQYVKQVNFFINDSSRIEFDTTRKPPNTAAHLFEASDPIVHDMSMNLCEETKPCSHGCNRKTGICSCTRGYVLFEDTKCTDRSDCLYLPCKAEEICSNTIGGFTCTCNKDYWRDPATDQCVPCRESLCPKGTFESRECPYRVCSECDESCPPEQYITSDCSMSSNIVCEACDPPCKEDEYEYKPCTNHTNRKCNKRSELPSPIGSSNLILESVSDRRNAQSANWLMDTPHKSQQYTTGLVRGSGINIRVSVKSVSLYPALEPVIHSISNDNDEFIANDGPPTILTTHCPYPMPIQYELLPVLHNYVTAAKPPNCPDCEIDLRVPCRTYQVFGKSAPLHPFDKSMVCYKPDALADMFGLNLYLGESGTINVQPSQTCEAIKNECDNCSRSCAEDIISQRNTNCSITGEDDGNSWSPRIMYCQNCCLQRECKADCSAKQQCKPVSCWKGNVAEFLLSAKFPQKTLEFYCNVQLNKTVKLISLDYVVLHNDKPLKTFSIEIPQTDDTVKQSTYSDGLLNIDYSTGITKVPDIIHGELDMKDLSQRYTSAIYNPQGTAASRVRVSRLDIIPKTPFALSTKWWSDCLTNTTLLKEHNCSESIMDKFLMSSGSVVDKQDEVNVSREAAYSYSLWNRSHQPYVRFSIPVTVSVIKNLYRPTSIDERSLRASVNRYSAGWRVVVDGRVQTCPGYFTLRMWELNKQSPLVEYEVAVIHSDPEDSNSECAREFSVSLNVAGGDVTKIKRQFRIEVVYDDGTRHFLQAESDPPRTQTFTVNEPEQVSTYPESSDRSVIMVMGPFLLIIGVTVLVLSIAWIVSVVIPRDHGPVTSSPNARGLLCLLYALIRHNYILVTSFSIFAFIWYALNGADLVIVQNYMDAVDTVISQQQYDLRALADFSTQTVSRQQSEFKSMREKCFGNIQILQDQSQQMIQKLSAEMSDEMTSLPLRNDLVTSLDNRARELKDKLETYRQDYNAFAEIASTKLVLEISKTLDDFEGTDWLSAARQLRGAAMSRRFSRQEGVNGFQKWLGLRTQLHTIQTNFVLDELPISNIDSLSLPPIPPSPEYKTVDLHSVFLPTHDLYPEMKEPQVASADSLSRSYGISLGTRLSVITVLVILVLFDVLSLMSRVAASLDTCQQILDGYIIEKTYSETYQDGCSSKKYISDKVTKKPHRVRYRLYKLILETNFIPLVIALVVVLGFTFVSLLSGLNFVSLKTLSEVGLFSSLIGPWNLTSNIALDNIHMNVQRINTVDIPTTEAMMNHYIERIEAMNNLYNNMSYYKWQIECGDSPSSRCGDFDFSKLVEPLNIKDMNCTLTPLAEVNSGEIPHTLTDIRARRLLLPYVEAFRRLIETSACLLLTYTSYILLVKMLSVVIWNFLTRCAYLPGVRIIITNKPEEEPPTEGATEDDDDKLNTTFNRNTIEEMSHEDSIMDNDQLHIDYDEELSDIQVDDEDLEELGLEDELIPNNLT